MDAWTLVLVVAAAYIAVVGLVRLMRLQRDILTPSIRAQLMAQKQERDPAKAPRAPERKSA